MKKHPSELFAELPACQRSFQPVPDFLQPALTETLLGWQMLPDTDPWAAGMPSQVLLVNPILSHEKRLEWHAPAPPPSDLESVDALELVWEQPWETPLETYLRPLDAQRLALYFSGNVDFLALGDTLSACFPYPIHRGLASKRTNIPGLR